MRPTLAVDLNMLDFVRGLFLNTAPNVTAWAETLEGFLSAHKFKLKTRNTLRKHFGNALQWYTVLEDMKCLWLQEVINRIRESVLHADDTQDSENLNDQPGGFHADHPSDYLRDRCPLCFGGKDWHQPDELMDVIVCLDACFTQKRCKSQNSAWSAPREHPETIFVPVEDVEVMKETVETAHPTKKKHTKPTEDGFEPGMKVSSAILDECFDSFAAADSN
ncbi:hypothetical protein CPB84DRAFT_1858289 [Gymnopilus junonius]|uniref:Uncharacterized protein n=1 Tax=Gymnopilus junonius TaxID=109634 RepID=A0A9P5TEB8_GYMJU|nr:hypothetical protein CPB84DRAFT_1858289 [Gymnopilus junonius]